MDNHVTSSVRIKQGLDIPVSGGPVQTIRQGPAVTHVALCGPDYIGLKPRMLVAEGDTVRLGQPLLIDKRDPVVQYCSPGQGTVTAVNRGARRSLESVVVRLDKSKSDTASFEPIMADQLQHLDRDQVAERLQQSGLWTAFRTRPFSRVPHSDSRPRSIFVTAIDTRPLAADPREVIRGQYTDFADGLRVLPALTPGNIYLCTAPDWNIDTPAIEKLRRVEFSGPHPAGLPGTHIHHIDPVGAERTVWHISYQDVIAIGILFRTGMIDNRRVVALGGDCLTEPHLMQSRIGVSIAELAETGIQGQESCRVISGSVLDGRTADAGLAYLGRYHEQVSVIPEGGDKYLLGWTGLFPWLYSATRTFLKKSGQKRRWAIPTSQNGRFSGMLPTRAFENVMPLDILPSPLLRALLVKDTDQAQALGCLELIEEDLALCSFVCPAKNDYGSVLRINLDEIERQG